MCLAHREYPSEITWSLIGEGVCRLPRAEELRQSGIFHRKALSPTPPGMKNLIEAWQPWGYASHKRVMDTTV
jgi:hypothetical protein